MAAEPKEEKNNDYVTLSLKDDKSKEVVNEAKIHLFGATVVSWKVQGVERLFVSSLAKLDGSKPIRGGIPLVFPQFGPGAMKQHGFARTLRWAVKDGTLKESSVTLVLNNSDETRKDPWNWNHEFNLEFSVKLNKNNSMTNELKISNNDDANNNDNNKEDEFSFTVLFHNYFGVNDIKDVRLSGLPCCQFKDDKISKNRTEYDENKTNEEIISINEATDVIYANHNNKDSSVTILNSNKNNKDEKIVVKRGNLMKDFVVWNPWAESAKGMADFGDNEYNNMICVEVGSVTNDSKITLQPGKSCVVAQELAVL